MYKVIYPFKDGKDNHKFYQVGDIYTGKNKDRIKELSSSDNRLGKPLIKKVEKPKSKKKK